MKLLRILAACAATVAASSCTITLDPSGNWSATPDPASSAAIADQVVVRVIEAVK